MRECACKSLLVMCVLVLALSGINCTETTNEDQTNRENSVETSSGDTVAYVGSAECSTCHRSIYETWQQTAHSNAVTDPVAEDIGVVADSDYDGTDDFKEGITLGSTSNSSPFATYYAAGTAPVLSYDATNEIYAIAIGDNTYNIKYAQGYKWKQRYFTQIGNSLYILPVQYNLADNTWVTYNPQNWWVKEGSTQTTTPVFASGETPITESTTTESWERKCAGCHATTGLTEVSVNSNGEFIASYAERNIGCESCHGPGETHVALSGGEGIQIVNPASLSSERATEVCAQCHSRGESIAEFTVGETTVAFEYPWNEAEEPYLPGDELSEFYTQTTAAAQFWSVASARSKGHHQQYNDQINDAHFAAGMTCFSCHDPHGSDYGNDLRMSVEDNSLCLSCHGKDGPNEATWAADGDISDHTNHAVSSIDASNPGAGDGSMCISCHMPYIAKSAINYDIRTHLLRAIYPEESAALLAAGSTAIPNACMNGACHTSRDQSDSTTKWSLATAEDIEEATACLTGGAGCPDATFAGWGDIEPVASTTGTDESISMAEGTTVTLTGSRSVDPNGNALTYAWVQVSGTSVTLSDATAASPTFTAAIAGKYVFSLMVNDGTLDSNEATVEIVISE